jgi:hypothetical protein
MVAQDGDIPLGQEATRLKGKACQSYTSWAGMDSGLVCATFHPRTIEADLDLDFNRYEGVLPPKTSSTSTRTVTTRLDLPLRLHQLANQLSTPASIQGNRYGHRSATMALCGQRTSLLLDIWVDRDGFMAGWTGCEDDDAGYLTFSHSEHHCRAASAAQQG